MKIPQTQQQQTAALLTSEIAKLPPKSDEKEHTIHIYHHTPKDPPSPEQKAPYYLLELAQHSLAIYTHPTAYASGLASGALYGLMKHGVSDISDAIANNLDRDAKKFVKKSSLGQLIHGAIKIGMLTFANNYAYYLWCDPKESPDLVAGLGQPYAFGLAATRVAALF